jgi:D-threo-aldose 1-dehydrogenase
MVEERSSVDPSELVPLGRTGVRISRLGLGTAPLGHLPDSREAEVGAIVERARTLGMRYIDTAPEYGHGLVERRLGRVIGSPLLDDTVISTKVGRILRTVSLPYRIRHSALETMTGGRAGLRAMAPKAAKVLGLVLARPTASPNRRPTVEDDPPSDSPRPVPICDFSYDGVMRSLEESLVRLGRDRVDILMIHEPDMHYGQAVHGAYRALARLKADGTVAAIGASTTRLDLLIRFAAETEIDCLMVGGRYTLLDPSAGERLLPMALARRISIILGGPFNSGILADPVPGTTFDHAPADAKRLAKALRIKAVSERHGVPLKAAALHFPFSHPAVASVVVGVASVAELEEDAMLLRTGIPGDFWQELVAEGLLAPDAALPA